MSAATAGRRIEDLDILEVAEKLLLRTHGTRFQVEWREGDSWSGSLNRSKGCWKDHKTGDGGGILALVEKALGCDRREAVAWLADNFGIERRELTVEERRRYARRLKAARPEAEEIRNRWTSLLDELREYRGLLLRAYHQIESGLQDDAEEWADALELAEACYRKLEATDGVWDTLRAASPFAVVRAFKRLAGRKV